MNSPLAPPDPPSTAAPAAVWQVGSLLAAVSQSLQSRFGAVAVRGELSGVTRAASGHWYFSLKDADGAAALVRCAMFRRAAQLVDFVPADGQQVELRGRVALYEPRGELQLVAESLQRVGAGTLYEEFLRRRARLAAEGLFDPARKRPLPSHPRAIGVVTSLAAAALRDVASALQRRAPHVPVVVYPSPVQGAEAPAALVAALAAAQAHAAVEVLLLVRGGGALEDLWAFNDERLVRAVAACSLPVVCGVGHETDVTLCDLAADLRAPTPTAAAELAAPPRADEIERLERHGLSMSRALQRALEQQQQRLDRLAQRLGQPGRGLGEQRQRLHDVAQRAARAGRRLHEREQLHLQHLQQRLRQGAQGQLARVRQACETWRARLDAQDPRQVLRRGYAWIQTADGVPVTSASRLSPGDGVAAVWADGQARMAVLDVATDDRATPPR